MKSYVVGLAALSLLIVVIFTLYIFPAFVTVIGFFSLLLVWHVIAFFIGRSQAGKRLNLPKCMDSCLQEIEYGKLAYSDDEESLTGSSMPGNTRPRNVVILKCKRYIKWLYLPLALIISNGYAQEVGPRGLPNLGNTCYFNSVMQTLSYTCVLQRSIHESKYNGAFSRHFERFCKWVSGKTSEENSSWTVHNFLNTTIKQFNEPGEMHKLFSNRAPRFSDRGQHDSHECLRHFLDELRKEERDCHKKSLPIGYDARRNLTVVDKVFGGHFLTVYVCMECGLPYHLFEPFLDISLPLCRGTVHSDELEESETRNQLPSMDAYTNATTVMMKRLTGPRLYKRKFPSPHFSIYDCLWYFTRTERIKDEYLCNDCYSKHAETVPTDERLTSATKQTMIFNPPAVLTIHLKRFELKPGGSVKLSDPIAYGELLDIAPYCSEFCLRHDPICKNIWYSLYGVVVHLGSLEFGHYFAYVKVREDESGVKKFLQEEYFDRDKTKDELIEMVETLGNIRRNAKVRGPENHEIATANKGIWYCMNDSRISEVTVDEVLNQEAYLLLYERI